MGEKFKPTPVWMAENYNKLNKELFGGELGNCILRPFTNGKGSQGKTLGWFKITAKDVKVERTSRKMFVSTYYGAKEYVDGENFYDLCKPCIELNANYSWTEHAMLATLAHEMCHYYTYMKGLCPKRGHGPEFYAIGNIVSDKSKGMFTIQRLADAEQMSEMELDADIQAKNDKRLANKKSKVSAIFVYNEKGSSELSITSSDKVINDIIRLSTHEPRWKQAERGLANKIVKSNDSDFIDVVFKNGYKRNFRTYRYWSGTKIDALSKQIFNYDYEVLYDNGGAIKPQKDAKQQTKEPIRYFVLKLTNGEIFKTPGNVYGALIKAIKTRFPNFSDETIQKLVNNPSNYKIMEENKKTIGEIITETINEFLNKEFKGDDAITIDPNMNLGVESPLETME